MDTGIKAQKVLQELAAIAFANYTDVVTMEQGVPVFREPGKRAPVRKAIASVEKTSSGIRVKFYDKLKALELLGKALGVFDGEGQDEGESPLLVSLLAAMEKEVDTGDLPELQQAAAAGDDLVETAGISEL